MTKQTIIFGGSFDPVHNGHLIIARAVAGELGAERVLLMPTGVNPLKSTGPVAGEHRLAMLKLAVQGDNLFEISDIELRRQPPSYTIDTVEELLRLGTFPGQLGLVIGADMIKELPKWRSVKELLGKVRLLVACRPPEQYESIVQAVKNLAGQLPAEYVQEIAASVVNTPLIDISSTDIRRRVSAGLDIDDMVPPAVADYIKRNGLYQQ